jgi:hypothetical protein
MRFVCFDASYQVTLSAGTWLACPSDRIAARVSPGGSGL